MVVFYIFTMLYEHQLFNPGRGRNLIARVRSERTPPGGSCIEGEDVAIHLDGVFCLWLINNNKLCSKYILKIEAK